MVYVTGDTHGDFRRIKKFCKLADTTKADTLIILGDSGLNYYTDLRSARFKQEAQRLPIKIFAIHGNHEERASNIPTYHPIEFLGGRALVEDDYPDLIFALDGEIYRFQTHSGEENALVIGGAYSVDKYYRLSNGYNWYKSEQPSDEIKSKVEQVIANEKNDINIVLSHTCPVRYIPTEWFISGIPQNTVDRSTEIWLDTIYDKISHRSGFNRWLCGHYHGDKIVDSIRFMFSDIIEL